MQKPLRTCLLILAFGSAAMFAGGSAQATPLARLPAVETVGVQPVWYYHRWYHRHYYWHHRYWHRWHHW